MQQVADWLEKLGMSEYGQRFAENRIDFSVLPDLTDQDLEKLGVVLGDRRKMLRAIGELTGASVPAPQHSAATKPAPLDTAERRQLTVMFTDLVGSSALSTRLDPEDLRAVIGAYHKCVAETVARFNGFLAKYMGDGVLVYFGYPQAHEDDAERAVQAGLALIEAVGKLSSVEPLQVRIGVGTGVVVVGDLVGSGEAQERGVVGETPNLAARLQAGTTPGTIAIDTTTRRLLGGLFEYRDLGAIEAKGFANRVQAYEVVRPSMVESRFEALRTATTPLVGRDEELDLLLRRWEQAKRGEGCAVLISGEPGIGKSRIAQTIVERLGGEPHTRLRYFCSPHYQDSALHPSIAQLERAAGFRREDTAEKRLAKLEAVLAQGTNDLSEAVSLLADLLSIPTGDRYPPLNLTPQKRKEKTLQALLAQLEGLAARQPVLMVSEDLHWSDPTTRESLDLLIDRVPMLRVLVILTFRPEFTPPWIGRPHVTMLTLNRLPRRQGAEMIAYVTGGKALPKEISDQIVDRTDGVPLFIEELTKTVVESGIVAEAGDHYAMARPIAPLAIPTSLQASLLARLDRLATTREVAQIGAALGRSFSYGLISAVAGMPQQKLDDALDKLASAELIFRRGTPPDAEYTFKHALVQDAAYDTLLKGRRQALHARIGQVLEASFPDTVQAQPELLAHHFTRAGLVDQAIEYCLRAGRVALSRSANVEATAQLQKGLQLLDGLTDPSRRDREEIDLQIGLGSAFMAARGLASPEMGRAYARAHELCRRTGDTSGLVPALWGVWMFHLNRAELTAATEAAEDLLRCTKDQGDATAEWIARRSVASIRTFLGEFTAARAQFEEAARLYPSRRDSIDARFKVETGGTVYPPGMLSWVLLLQGHPDQALVDGREVVAAVRELNQLYGLAIVLHQNCLLHQLLRDRRTVEERSAELIALTAEQGFAHWLATGTIFRGWCMAISGELEAGAMEMRRGLADKQATGAQLKVPYYLGLMAAIEGPADRDGAISLLAEALARVDKTGERWFEAELHRLWGELLLPPSSLSEIVDAEVRFRRALAIAGKQKARFWELRAATSLARLWRDQGKRTEARELLAPVYGWFTEGFDTRDLKEAKALLEALSS